MKKSTLFITLGLLAACSGKPKETKVSLENKEIETEIPVVDLASVINQQVPDTFTWNSIAKNIQLIPISTSNKTLMGVSRGVIYMGEDYYIIAEYQTQTLYRVDMNGKIQKAFRHVGNGPGEYVYLTRISFNPEDSTIQVFDNGNQKRIFYDVNGNLRKEISLKDKEINLNSATL